MSSFLAMNIVIADIQKRLSTNGKLQIVPEHNVALFPKRLYNFQCSWIKGITVGVEYQVRDYQPFAIELHQNRCILTYTLFSLIVSIQP